MSRFEAKAALITGAGSGIGRATSLALAAEGAFVWVTDFDKESAEKTAGLIHEAGGRAQALRLDVSDEAEWEAAYAQVDTGEVPLGVLVNCAGKSMITDTFSMALSDLRLLLSINVEGTFLGMKHGIPRVAKAGGGAVVNMSSIMGIKGQSRMAGYCASKAGIRMMTKAVALECAELRNGVRVNSIHPGIVDTPAWTRHSNSEVELLGDRGADASESPAVDFARKMVPIGVPCSAEEVAEAILYLASPAARHITGAELVIDGGMTAD